jgi:3-dehydroquinate synthase
VNTVYVELGERRYPIHIGAGLLREGARLTPYLTSPRVMIVTNETVAPLYLARLEQALAGYETHAVVLPDGERYKTLSSLERVITALLEARLDRRCTLIALGGGVVGDITGFAAACYQRGVSYCQVPTTLLAQVDSSVGGKTGVNHALGKNMIGAFHQPVCVLADTATLNTLPAREYRAGLAEVVKYGLIRDHGFFLWLEAHLDALLEREPAAVAYAIERSCANKAEIVAADERESGARALLNLGHTFGHAIETGLGYGTWLHGEAVAAGIGMAADLSVRLGWLDPASASRITALLRRAQLPVRVPPQLAPERMLTLMAVDKKSRAGTLRLVLLSELGQALVTADYDPEALQATLTHSREPSAAAAESSFYAG